MTQRIFLDTNIILDLLGERQPFYDSIARIATLAEKGKIVLVASSISFATVNYFLTRYENARIAREKLQKFKVLCEIGSVNAKTVEKGLNSPMKDFEDALQYFCATDSNCEVILTRNLKDFKKSVIPVMTANEFLKRMKAESSE